ncbi:signal-regulatory protein beta-1-like isoform X2 [Trachemys scripta elegans]|uniref:signal-regulatory protein beta-1-like isoform X2 n=1 Tax=Trachemys scripta elegans TaxID=31138 RepID=UPI0015540990|nr:signal-regulatory protein beta-1-like isoform X2 [Trachemys scripta elegans]
MAFLTHTSGLSRPCLVLLLLLEIPGAGAQEFQLLQPQGAVLVSPGETLTLICSVTGLVPVGPMKWFKGSGSGRQLVYAEVGSLPRVTRAVSGSYTDFTIRISDTRPEDAGIYRCVKFMKGSGPDEEIRSGAGTVVSVSGRWPLAIPALWIGLFLEKVLIAAFLLFSFLSTMSKGLGAVSWFSRTVAACQHLCLCLCPCRPGNESTDAPAVSPAGRAEGAQA